MRLGGRSGDGLNVGEGQAEFAGAVGVLWVILVLYFRRLIVAQFVQEGALLHAQQQDGQQQCTAQPAQRFGGSPPLHGLAGGE